MGIDKNTLETILKRHESWLDKCQASVDWELMTVAPIPATYGAAEDADKALPNFRADFSGADLHGVDLSGAILTFARLRGVDLSGGNLRKAVLGNADLQDARLRKTNLRDAQLYQADLTGANLTETQLAGADFTEAVLSGTVFGRTNLAEVKALGHCHHLGPSIIDFPTLQQSGPLPLAFLRGVGLPDDLIGGLPPLLNKTIQLYSSCFISHSSKDKAFADRLYADLQSKGARCWFAPHDMPIGAKIIDALDEAIALQDKVLLILSEGALASDWVEGEVTRALDEERTRKQVVLFPVRLDDAVMQTSEGWARLLRGQRNIGDFTGWKEHGSYQKSFDRLMRDLRVETSG
jgi:TIR domain-containing protein/pentapeptide repeat protein